MYVYGTPLKTNQEGLIERGLNNKSFYGTKVFGCLVSVSIEKSDKLSSHSKEFNSTV